MRNQQQYQPPLHADWKAEIENFGIQPEPHRSDFVAYILGTGTNGRRYCRTVELLAEDAEELQRFDTVFELVRTPGPSVCREIVEGQDLPSEAEMPLLSKL